MVKRVYREPVSWFSVPERGEGIRAPDFLTFETSRVELRLLEAMGKETANIHLGTEEKWRAILKDLRGRKGNWLGRAAQAMANAMEKDWRVWRERQQS